MLHTAERVQLPRPRQSRIDLDQPRTQSESTSRGHNRCAKPQYFWQGWEVIYTADPRQPCSGAPSQFMPALLKAASSRP